MAFRNKVHSIHLPSLILSLLSLQDTASSLVVPFYQEEKLFKTIRLIKQHLAPVELKELFDYCVPLVGSRDSVLIFLVANPLVPHSEAGPRKAPGEPFFMSPLQQIRAVALRRSQ